MISLQDFMNTFNTSYSNLLQFTPKKMVVSSKLKNNVYCIETLVTKFHSSYFANNPKLLEQLPRYNARIQNTMNIRNYISLVNTFQIVCREFLDVLLSYVPYNVFLDITNTQIKTSSYSHYETYDIYDIYDILNNQTPVSNIYQLSPSTYLAICVYPEEAKRLENEFNKKALVFEKEDGKVKIICPEITCKFLDNENAKKLISKEYSWTTKTHKQSFHHIEPTTNQSIKFPLHTVIENTYKWKYRD